MKFDLAIPDSFLYGINSEIDRTFKVFQLARALSIFRVEKLFIFHDKIINPNKYEVDFLITLLEYLDTPQYLRKKIYPKIDILKYAGKLHPLRSPHHKDKIPINLIKEGEIRVGIIEQKGNGVFYTDVGLDSLILYKGKIKSIGKKIDVKLIKKNNMLTAVDIDRTGISNYWGYNIFYFSSVKEIVKKYENTQIILTSRLAENYNSTSFSANLKINSNDGNSILIFFGSPKFGLKDIFYKEGLNHENFNSYNFFPKQGTQTVRLEESIFGVLSILNCLFFS